MSRRQHNFGVNPGGIFKSPSLSYRLHWLSISSENDGAISSGETGSWSTHWAGWMLTYNAIRTWFGDRRELFIPVQDSWQVVRLRWKPTSPKRLHCFLLCPPQQTASHDKTCSDSLHVSQVNKDLTHLVDEAWDLWLKHYQDSHRDMRNFPHCGPTPSLGKVDCVTFCVLRPGKILIQPKRPLIEARIESDSFLPYLGLTWALGHSMEL